MGPARGTSDAAAVAVLRFPFCNGHRFHPEGEYCGRTFSQLAADVASQAVGDYYLPFAFTRSEILLV